MQRQTKTILVITDGIGHKPQGSCNAFLSAKKPTYDWLFANAPHTLISTHGLSVGLPQGQMGNSEVGHMTLGSGRILYQDLVKISKALQDGILAKNQNLLNLFSSSKDIHIVGLLSDGGVHSHIEHIIGLSRIAKKNDKKVWLHIITDGRDVSPTSASIYLKQIEAIRNIQIATISGRFYTMDRDNRWDRVEKGYGAIAKATPKTALSPEEYIQESYAKGENDEFIEPVSFGDYGGMNDGDGVIMANFRSDRAREITKALGDEDFDMFQRKQIKLNLVTMTAYDATFNYPILFPKENPTNTLSEIISQAGLKQMHIAETEKYAHVTFFFNGGKEEPFTLEDRMLIPSPDVRTYDLQPQMSAPEVGSVTRSAMEEGYDFIVVNFANGDMVGHTGNFDAAINAVEAVDKELGLIIDKAKKHDYSLILTSDHGNCEEMCDGNGHVLTNHTVGDVWCFVLADGVTSLRDGCGLNHVAPSVLKLMGLDVPSQMDGSLF